MLLSKEDLPAVAACIRELCGIIVDDSKSYLIEHRLGELVQELGADSFVQLCEWSRDPKVAGRIIDCITTNETLFFRDGSPFDALEHKVLPELFDRAVRRGRRFRIWSAACSTGQEPVSLAILLHDLLPDIADWDVQILATDISQEALDVADLGFYPRHALDRCGRPGAVEKYFADIQGRWRVDNRIRRLIEFRPMNLLRHWGAIGPFDLVLCRNVAIYFDPEARQDLFRRMRSVLDRDGALLVGTSEDLSDVGPEFQPQTHCGATVYFPNRESAVGGSV